MDGVVTPRGTHQMLLQWRERTSREDQTRQLRRALEEALLVEIADKYVPKGGSFAKSQDIIARKIYTIIT